MDSTAVPNATTAAEPFSAGTLETLIGVVVALAILRLELERSVGTLNSMQCCKWFVKHCGPEVLMLAAFFAVGALLRARGDTASPATNPDEDEAWEAIKQEWPLLLTADTLLSFQAMLRMLLLASAAMRSGSDAAAPLGGATSALMLASGFARVLVVARTDAYMLDGPLGGYIPVLCEVGALPLLLILIRGACRQNLILLGSAIALAAWIASRNYLALSDDVLSNIYFSLSHILDVFAAVSCVVRTLLVTTSARGGCPSMASGFLYLVLPIQQSLSAYYFLEAFTPVDALIGAGCPFELLQYGNAAAFGAYIGALALFVVDAGEVQQTVAAAQTQIAAPPRGQEFGLTQAAS
mmetsp:Transcript_28655/g.66454  ORF Transcript_28655/g.66454 Transcript_28655/m.66454 type:complete len:352 (+) Transcript_28655:110-1165(+)